MYDWVLCDISSVVHEHESIESGQESCSLRAISIEFVGVNTFKSACFIFLIVLGKIFKRKGVVSGTVRTVRGFITSRLRRSHSKGSKDIFILWPLVFIVALIIRRVIKRGWGSFFLFLLYSLCCGYYSFYKWYCFRFGWSFGARRWLRRFSTLFK